MRYLVLLFVGGAFATMTWAFYKFWSSVKNVEFAYVRFRDGILTLKKTRRFGEDSEVSFIPSSEHGKLEAEVLAGLGEKLRWFTYPSGFEVKQGSPEIEAIGRALRMGHNTQLLDAECATRPDK